MLNKILRKIREVGNKLIKNRRTKNNTRVFKDEKVDDALIAKYR